MSFINTTTPTRIWIGGKEYTDFLVSGSVSDESTLSSAIVKTSGTIALSGVHNSLVVREFPLPIGTEVVVQCSLPGGYSTRHPRGTLYLVNTTINYETQTVTLEVGCSLFLISTFEASFRSATRRLFSFIPASYSVFDVKEFTLSELSQVLEALGYVMYQDKNGSIQCVKAFGSGGLGSVSSSSKFTSYDNLTAISVESLSDASAIIDPSELVIVTTYDIPVREEVDPEEEEEPEPDPLDEDTDDDGIPDVIDPDDDNDGIFDWEEDNDGDGIPDYLDNSQEEEKEEDKPTPKKDTTLIDRQYHNTPYLKLKPYNQCLQTYYGTKEKISDATILRCGKYLSPEYLAWFEKIADFIENPDCKKPITKEELEEKVEEFYAYEVKGSLETEEEAYFGDSTEKRQAINYGGPGGQVDYEYTSEICSIWKAGNGAISQLLENISKEYDLAIEEANAKMSDANEYAQLRDDNNIYDKPVEELLCLSEKELLQMINNHGFYDCMFGQRLREAGFLIRYAGAVYSLADTILSRFWGRIETNITERFVRFGAGGEVLERREKNYVHTCAAKATSDLIRRAGKVFEQEEEQGSVIDEREQSKLGRYGFGPSTDVITGNAARWPSHFLRTEKVEVYRYGLNVVTQKVYTYDYENPANNTIDVKESTDYSSAATEEVKNTEEQDSPITEPVQDEEVDFNLDTDQDGLFDWEDPDDDNDAIPDPFDPDADGDGIPDEEENQEEFPEPIPLASCSIPTESKETINKIIVGNTTPTVGSGWAGGFVPAPEEISMPIAFKPLVPERLQQLAEEEMTERSCNLLTNQFILHATTNMAVYEFYISKYLAISLSKRLMDNRGIRVVEKMRPELFDYYPFMPLTVVLSANRKVLLARASAASWVFDSTNALCSLDCYVLNS